MPKPRQWKLTPPKISENDVEHGVEQVCAYRGYKIERIHCGVFRTMDGRRVIRGAKKGTPDYVATHEKFPGVYIEVKRPGETLSPDQEQTIWEMKTGFRLAIAVIDSPQALSVFLDQHEAKFQ